MEKLAVLMVHVLGGGWSSSSGAEQQRPGERTQRHCCYLSARGLFQGVPYVLVQGTVGRVWVCTPSVSAWQLVSAPASAEGGASYLPT